MENKKVIIISASSDIGKAMCGRYQAAGSKVFGTYRTNSPAVRELKNNGVSLVSCDLKREATIKKACSYLKKVCPKWDVLILCPGTQEPIGLFLETDFKKWKDSIEVNFVRQLEIVHKMLSCRNKKSKLGACVLFFAGGGTNNATLNYSAYTISKIALIKMCELLDAEIKDTRFAIVGPGWVKTKIHKETLKAKGKAGDNYERTKVKIADDAFTPMEEVLDCCEWIINSPREAISGRNFSVVFDMWGKDVLLDKLISDTDMYKLRRYGNEFLTKGEKRHD